MTKAIDLIFFGAAGDLANRKLFPALYRLHSAGLLADKIRILGLARGAMAREEFAQSIHQSLQNVLKPGEMTDDQWQTFSQRLHYLSVDFTNEKHYKNIKLWLDDKRLAIYYLATPPSIFEEICHHLHAAGCVAEQSRLVLEKPIGKDLISSRQVNDTVAQYLDEPNVYRIDHYLGKETVQNLLALRFANRVINSQWDNTCIDHVQITAAETVGIEGRWGYYDAVGQLRDMVQNHLLQLLCMVAMEPPNSLQAEEIRAEKMKLLRALRPITKDTVADNVVRGQYSAGWVNGKPVVGYMEEEGSSAVSSGGGSNGGSSGGSSTETFVALKAYIDNWRWAGVPFYLRTGKRMGKKVTQVVITYKDSPHSIFTEGKSSGASNRLVIRLQPNEGIQLEMVSKKQSLNEHLSLEKRLLNLDFYEASGESRIADAYERLFLEVINGNQWLFVSRDEIEASWQWCDALLAAWHHKGVAPNHYGAGSWGPSKADMLIEKDQRSWYEG